MRGSPPGNVLTTLLHCPACSVPLRQLRCARCSAQFRAVDGIPCCTDPVSLTTEQRAMCAPDWRAHSASAAQQQCDDASRWSPADECFRERDLEAVFGLAHYPEHCGNLRLRRELAANPATLEEIARRVIPLLRVPGPVLEIGCGPGRLLQTLATHGTAPIVGLDLRIGMLRLARQLRDHGSAPLPFRRLAAQFEPIELRTAGVSHSRSKDVELLQANLYQPPFADRTFAAVIACSVLDVVADPLAALLAMERLVAPGGLLLIVAPWQWQASSTPADRWWSAPTVVLEHTLTSLGHDIVERIDDLLWVIPSHERLVHRYFLQGLLTRKRTAATDTLASVG